MKKCLFLLVILLALAPALRAEATQEDFNNEAEERKNEPIQSNEVERWPEGPALGAESALLMDADSGTILYAKNIDEELFPASTTKLMTCLVAIENCPLNEPITVYQSAIDANESDGSHMNLKAGEVLTLEELLYGILINSANEACNAVGEHIGGTMNGYVDMMNARAAELGCTHTHFVTTNGLHSEDHYTSAHDLALIARAFFSHDILCNIACTSSYVIPETDTHGEHSLKSKNKLYPGQEYAYEGLLGSKTGFTSKSRQVLVSCAQKGELKLICVIMREETPHQFTDTTALFDYGFAHFAKTGTAALESRFSLHDADFFGTSDDVFGSTTALMGIEQGAQVVLPDTLSISDLETVIRYDGLPPDELARVDYEYEGMRLGSTAVHANKRPEAAPRYISVLPGENEEGITYVNIHHVLNLMLGTALAFILLHLAWQLLKVLFARRRKLARIRRHRSEVVKSRSTLRRSYRRHGPERKGPQKKAPPKYVSPQKKRPHPDSQKPRRTIRFD